MKNRRGAEGTEKDEGVEIYTPSQRSLRLCGSIIFILKYNFVISIRGNLHEEGTNDSWF